MKINEITELFIHDFKRGDTSKEEVLFIRRLDARIETLRRELLFDPSLLIEKDSIHERIVYLRNRVICELFIKDRQEIESFVERNYVDYVALTYGSWMLGLLTAGLGYFLPKMQLLQVGLLINVTVLGCLARLCKRSENYFKEALVELESEYVKLFSMKSVLQTDTECLICLSSISPKSVSTGHLALGRVPHLMHRDCFNEFIEHSQATSYNTRLVYKCPCCQLPVMSHATTES